MQTINTVYAIYNKTGTLVAGPQLEYPVYRRYRAQNATMATRSSSLMNKPTGGLWLSFRFAELMIICSWLFHTTNDPTGTWHKYSFDVADMPDYEKFGIWQDGYYMGTNNSIGNDIYVFQRSQMLIGGTLRQ